MLKSQVGIGTDNPKATLHIGGNDPSAPTVNDGLIIPKVLSFPSGNPSEVGLELYLDAEVEGNPKGFYFWNGNEWKRMMAVSKNDIIPISGNYSASATEKIYIADIYEEASFDLNFFANCYSRDAHVTGTVSPDFINVVSYMSFTTDAAEDRVDTEVSDNLSTNVKLGVNSFANVRLVIENNKLYWIADYQACGSTIRLNSGNITYSGASSGNSSTWSKNVSDVYYSAGNVGIGTNTPTEALDVVGNIHFSGTLSNLSDKRMKENIESFKGGLKEVNALKPVRYNYNNKYGDINTETKHIGLIAQEVEKIAPYLIKDIQKETSDGTVDLKAVKYNDIILMLINSVQELNNRVIDLENQLKNKP
ncbi:uncharacterized protein UJ101_00508 [Flavobacteriaceae bacterium UJ101]|nr:uncharacterized protein UJ101_00508 [Flavobacteriaceae bacterium UJ101]